MIGVLKGGVDGYKASGKSLDILKNIEASDVTPDMAVYDVRNPPELEHGYVENAHNTPLIEINKKSMEGTLDAVFPKDTTIYIHCKGGARSIMACSILRKYGYTNQININGGFDSIKKDNKHVKIVQ